jgi:glycosyltransferase involved in cell wall biosynthesis
MDGVNGYIVPSRDPNSLAKAILRLINDLNNAREIGLEGRRSVERRFSMDVITRKLNDVYELVLKRK